MIIERSAKPAPPTAYTLHSAGHPPLTADSPADFIRLMILMGHEQTGTRSNPSQRLELQGAPTFRGICGPMYDGPQGIRYECTDTYAALSQELF